MKKLIILSALFFGMLPLMVPIIGELNEKPVVCVEDK